MNKTVILCFIDFQILRLNQLSFNHVSNSFHKRNSRFTVTVNEQDRNALMEFVQKRGGNIAECFEPGEEVTREGPGEVHESSASQKSVEGGYYRNVLHNTTWIRGLRITIP